MSGVGEYPRPSPYGSDAAVEASSLAALRGARDFRDVLGEIVQKRLGNPDNLSEVFPGYSDWKIRGVAKG